MQTGQMGSECATDDEMLIELDASMTVEGAQNITDWFDGNRTLFKHPRSTLIGDSGESKESSDSDAEQVIGFMDEILQWAMDEYDKLIVALIDYVRGLFEDL